MIQEQLQQTFSDNFVAYWRSHASHINITGRNFYSDHKLLEKIYSDLQDNIDDLGEFIRQVDDKVKTSLTEIITNSAITDYGLPESSDDLLIAVYDDLEALIRSHQDLEEVAEDEEHDEIANYAQDRIRALKKFCWMLRSTVGDDMGPLHDGY